jgi:ribonucleotide monophosphatase NagD (HAD superfamily)
MLISLEEIVPSSWAAAEYLRTERPDVKKAFVVGQQGLVDELGG